MTIEPIDAQQVCDPEPVLAQVSPSVVSIWAIKQKGLETHINVIGCGLIVDSRGLILTSATLTDDIESLDIIDSENRKYQASVIATDKKTQLTLLKVDSINNEQAQIFETAQLADFKRVKRGDTVFVLGSRRTPDSWELTVKTGRITDPYQSLIIKKVRYRDLIQTDVSLTSENAGGPLVNLEGEVLGFALPFVRPEGSSTTFSYAVGVNQGKNFLARLPIPQWTAGTGEPICSWLGAEMLPVNSVSVQFLSWEAQQVPVIIIILISLLAGVIISSILGLIKQSKLKDKIRRLQREIEDLKYPPVVPPDEDEELER